MTRQNFYMVKNRIKRTQKVRKFCLLSLTTLSSYIKMTAFLSLFPSNYEIKMQVQVFFIQLFESHRSLFVCLYVYEKRQKLTPLVYFKF